MAVVLDFDDEVLGAPAYPGLLYLLSTHRRLANVSDKTVATQRHTVSSASISYSLTCARGLCCELVPNCGVYEA